MPSWQDIRDFANKNGIAALAAVFLGFLLWSVMGKLDAAHQEVQASEARTRAALEQVAKIAHAEHVSTRALVRKESAEVKAVILDAGVGPDGVAVR